MEIRTASYEDLDGILNVYAASFDDPKHSILLAKLQTEGIITAALVGVEYGEIVAHIAFSEVKVVQNDDNPPIQASTLVCLAIAPTHQGHGLGSEFLRQGVEICTENGDEAVFSCVNSKILKRFGFYPIHDDFIKTSKNDQDFMVLELKSGVFDRFCGLIDFPPAFDI